MEIVLYSNKGINCCPGNCFHMQVQLDKYVFGIFQIYPKPKELVICLDAGFFLVLGRRKLIHVHAKIWGILVLKFARISAKKIAQEIKKTFGPQADGISWLIFAKIQYESDGKFKSPSFFFRIPRTSVWRSAKYLPFEAKYDIVRWLLFGEKGMKLGKMSNLCFTIVKT